MTVLTHTTNESHQLSEGSSNFVLVDVEAMEYGWCSRDDLSHLLGQTSHGSWQKQHVSRPLRDDEVSSVIHLTDAYILKVKINCIRLTPGYSDVKSQYI
jgi:hypothetical protein